VEGHKYGDVGRVEKMVIYPYNSPIILTDETFVLYGGITGTTTPEQRQLMYQVAEKKVSAYLGTLLLPTTVTGTYQYPNSMPPEFFIGTDYGYVSSVDFVQVRNIFTGELYNIQSNESITRFFRVHDDTYGYIFIRDYLTHCNGDWYNLFSRPYDVKVVYTAGLPSGAAQQPDILMALSIIAQLNLNELGFPSANEGVGDIGITEFSTLEYREKRKPFRNTVLGRSARADKARELLDGAVKKARKAIRFP